MFNLIDRINLYFATKRLKRQQVMLNKLNDNLTRALSMISTLEDDNSRLRTILDSVQETAKKGDIDVDDLEEAYQDTYSLAFMKIREHEKNIKSLQESQSKLSGLIRQYDKRVSESKYKIDSYRKVISDVLPLINQGASFGFNQF